MGHSRLKRLVFWALCCDLGLMAKRLIGPAANLITDNLHIPGGIGTSFSLMFVVIAAAVLPGRFAATLMSAVQGGLMLILGRVGSMGALAPIGYIVPGLMIDGAMALTKDRFCRADRLEFANALGALGACLTANLIVFRLSGLLLLLYASLSMTTGLLCGRLGESIVRLLERSGIAEREKKSMKKSAVGVIALVLMLVLTLGSAVAHMEKRQETVEGCLTIVVGETETDIVLDTLETCRISGTVVNGKGVETEIDTDGYEIAAILEAACLDVTKVESVSVTASDAYTAMVDGSELAEAGKCVLILR
ncbi:MAG: hypothetical protein MJ099_06730, partial [Clostridia bacterium]|nr:hypothetical protein [Clostridia bacterium]